MIIRLKTCNPHRTRLYLYHLLFEYIFVFFSLIISASVKLYWYCAVTAWTKSTFTKYHLATPVQFQSDSIFRINPIFTFLNKHDIHIHRMFGRKFYILQVNTMVRYSSYPTVITPSRSVSLSRNAAVNVCSTTHSWIKSSKLTRCVCVLSNFIIRRSINRSLKR